jgi:hypothetical protein
MGRQGFANHNGDATAGGIKITSAGRKVAVMPPVRCKAQDGEYEAEAGRAPTGPCRHFDGDSPPAVGFAPSAGLASASVGSGFGLSASVLR